MKTLLLMRHAKSSWKDHSLTDLNRPLKKRGHKDAARMGTLLKDRELVPQKILCSPAERARQTVTGLVEKSGFQGEVEYVTVLYMPEPGDVIAFLQGLPKETERVIVVSHNPGLESLAQILSGQVESLPTASIAYLSVPIKDWADLNMDTKCDLVDLYRPRDLK